MNTHPLAGVYAAAVTPLNADQSIDFEGIPPYLEFLAERGCHGALLLGTTGEGPSFSLKERLAIFEATLPVHQSYPDFKLLAGTGTPSLEETIILTKSAFDLGYQGVVVLPPYYYHQATEYGLYKWFEDVIEQGVPQDRYLLGYHFPSQSGVPIPLGVVKQLRKAFPGQFAGLKDSTGNAEHTREIGKDLDRNIAAFVGNGKLLSQALIAGASGCITATANLLSPTFRKIWDAHQDGRRAENYQEIINYQREILGRYTPFPISVKVLLATKFNFPNWAVRSPLTSFSPDRVKKLIQEIDII